MSVEGKPAEDGFELGGEFYRWAISDQGKDLMLIDRFTAMPIPEFFRMIEDGFDRGRAPVLLAMLATSIRAKHPDWTVERIARLVMDTSLTAVEFIEAEEEDVQSPPADGSAAAEAAEPTPSPLQPDGSSSSQTPTDTSNSETLYAVPA